MTTPNGGSMEVTVAEDPVARLLGLAGLGEERPRALLLPGCHSVHGLGMRFELDVCFLEWPAAGRGDARVMAIAPMRRGGSARISRASRAGVRARRTAVLELPAGMAATLAIEPASTLAIGHMGASRT